MDYTYDTNHIIESHGIRREAVDFKYHIHCLETEAYSSILMAFIAQSDLLSWGKEALLTELRKELNVTDGEHGEILKKINSNESIEWIREQRKRASHAQEYINANTPRCPSASLGSSMIRQVPSSASFYHQKNISHNQASLNSIHISSSMPPTFNGDLLSAEFVHGSTEQSMEVLNHDFHQLPPMGRGGVLKGKYQPNQYFHPSESLKLKNRTDLIEIRATNGVIHDVEKMLFSRKKKPDPVDIERAKQTLNEQEGAILAALSKVADLFERDDVERHDLQKYSQRTRNDDTYANISGLVDR